MERVVAVTTGQFELHEMNGEFICQHTPRIIRKAGLIQQRIGLGQVKVLMENPPEALTQDLLDKHKGNLEAALAEINPPQPKASPKAKG